MTPRRLLLRSLSYHRGIHIAVALGVAVGTAVLAGALLVGDSVRGSLRALALDRLGAIDHALVADRYFREALAGDLSEQDERHSSIESIAPAVLIRGSLTAAESGARASSINIHGVDERFWEFFETPETLPAAREVLLNEALAREIGVRAGDAALLRFQSDTLIPSESVMGRKEDNVRTLRLTVAAILPDRGAGRFGLSPSQQLPFNVFLPIETVQRALEQEGRANALFVSGGYLHPPTTSLGDVEPAGSMVAVPGHDLNLQLSTALELADLNLSIRTGESNEFVSLETDRIVLEQQAAQAAQTAARNAELEAFPVLTYLANSITAGERSIPYSTVTALETTTDMPSGPLRLTNGQPAPPIEDNEIFLNDWAANDLRASPGDSVELTYYVVGEQGTLDTASHTFRLKGVVRLSGLAADPDLAPVYKGMSDADRMGEWDPPFPVDLNRIRDTDEEYWEEYRTAPKAFVSLQTAKKLWTSRFGQLTSIRIAPKAGQSAGQTAETFRTALRQQLDPAAYGLAFQPVKQQALEASTGATDFSGLFIGFSMFLIVSAAMLVALLFRLGVERRAKEIGLLLSTGHPVPMVRRLLLTEGALVAVAGCLLGIPAAVGYGALMVHGLSTWWSDAVGGSFLDLYVSPLSLAGGAVGGLVMMVLSIWLAVRKLERLSPRAMLAGALEGDTSKAAIRRSRRRPLIVAWGSALLALVLIVLAIATEAVAAVGAFFGVGALLLIALLAFFRYALLRPARTMISPAASAPIVRLGARNGARYPTRSVLSAALVASATFVIVAVAMNRHDVTSREPSFESGDGGFRWIAESDLPVYPRQFESRENELPPMEVFPFRVEPGEDASCLNLYRPSRPTLLGAPQGVIERDGFAFQGTLAETEQEAANPWLILDKKLDDGAIPVFGDANSVMWILHLGLGQALEVPDGQGRKRRLVIAGLLSRSVFQSQLIMSEAHFLEMYPSHSGYNLFLIETQSEEAGVALEERLAGRGFDATRTADRLAGYLVVENTYLSTFQTLGGLGLLLGTLGLAVVMVRNVLERRGELALLQAVGFTEGSISWLVFAENAFLLVFGIVIGTATALLAVFPHLLSGLAEPPWLSLSLTLAAIVAVGLLAGAAAVAASLRSPLLAALRRE